MSVKLFYPEYTQYYFEYKNHVYIVKMSLKTNLPRFIASDMYKMFDMKDGFVAGVEFFDFDDLVYFAEIYPEHREDIILFMEFIIKEGSISSRYYNDVIAYLKDID